MLFPKARVIAFEPIPANFELLKKNIRRINWKTVELNQRCDGTKERILRIHEPLARGRGVGAGIIPKGGKESKQIKR